MFGKHPGYDTFYIPSIVYTFPEIATVGRTVNECQEKGTPVLVGRYSFSGIGRAHCEGHEDGYAEIIVCKQTHLVLGASVIGEKAGELILPMTIAMQHEITADCLVNTVYPHPTYSEIWSEAIHIAMSDPMHVPLKRNVSHV